jgi:hypothetical protein
MAVADAVEAELTRLRAAETVEGAIALRLAEQLDAPRNGMAVAGDAKELRAVLMSLRELTPAKADPIDELNAKREARESNSQAV